MCDLQPDTTQITAGDVWGCLAQIASTTNDPETAIKHAKKSIAIFEAHDVGTFRMPQAYNELAEAYIAAGRWEEAVVQTDLAIKGYLALPPILVHYPDWAMMNKGLSLRKLGRYEEATEVLETLLEFREKTFGPMDRESFKTGQCFLFLAKVLYCQGRIPECLDLYLKSLTQYHSTIGPKHFRVAAVCYDVGTIYITTNEPGQAV
jgi:tetratricopeptide (TPR) repeat protein